MKYIIGLNPDKRSTTLRPRFENAVTQLEEFTKGVGGQLIGTYIQGQEYFADYAVVELPESSLAKLAQQNFVARLPTAGDHFEIIPLTERPGIAIDRSTSVVAMPGLNI